MSKAARSRAANLEKNRIKKEREEFEAKKAKVRKVTAIITTSILAALIVITIVGLAVYNVRMNSGEYLRNQTAASSSNIDVDAAMMTYFYNDVYNTFVSNYGSYVQYYGLNPQISTKDQEISEGETWFEYFMSGAQNNVTSLLALNEAAAAEGMALTENEIAAIKNRVDRIDPALFGRGVNRDDIYRAKLIEALALKYQFAKQESFAPSSAEIKSQFEADPKSYQTIDYIVYPLDWSNEAMTEEEADTASARLASATNLEAFKLMMGEYIKNAYPNMTDEELAEEIGFYEVDDALYTDDNEFFEWAFGKAKVGETHVVKDSDMSCTYVYMLTSEPTRNEGSTVSVRHILFTAAGYKNKEKALEKAEEVLDEFKSGDMSEESFAELALAWSSDEGSYYNGGLYENIQEGTMVKNFNDWCFFADRKAGDVEIVETDFGYHIMYFVSEGPTVWESLVKYKIVGDRFDELYQKHLEQYTVVFNNPALNDIPG